MPGRWAHRRLVAAFGANNILQPDGTIDRARLRELAFASPAARAQLNRATHTAVLVEIFLQIVQLRLLQWEPFVVLDAPLLFETHLDWVCDRVLVVSCTHETQLQRLIARDGGDRVAAQRIIDSQMPLDRKTARADAVVDNSGALTELPHSVTRALQRIGRA
jgi:dephospho-CoA kinase